MSRFRFAPLDISDFSGRLRFLDKLGMTLGLIEIFNAQVLIQRLAANILNLMLEATGRQVKKVA